MEELGDLKGVSDRRGLRERVTYRRAAQHGVLRLAQGLLVAGGWGAHGWGTHSRWGLD